MFLSTKYSRWLHWHSVCFISTNHIDKTFSEDRNYTDVNKLYLYCSTSQTCIATNWLGLRLRTKDRHPKHLQEHYWPLKATQFNNFLHRSVYTKGTITCRCVRISSIYIYLFISNFSKDCIAAISYGVHLLTVAWQNCNIMYSISWRTHCNCEIAGGLGIVQ